MPKSKRDRVVALTVVKKKDRAWKESLVRSIRDCISAYPSVFVFRCENMRNDAFKGLREDLSETSRFFVGGNKLMRAAFGKSEEEEVEKGAAAFARHIKVDASSSSSSSSGGFGGGHKNEERRQKETKKEQRKRGGEANTNNNNNATTTTTTTTTGIVFTHLNKEDVMRAMKEKETKDFARVGQIATETIVCPEGQVKNAYDVPMSHTLEATLRKHGLPTKLNKGVVECVKEKTICKRGAKLSADQCALLRQFGFKLATFKLRLAAGWEKATGETEVFKIEDDEDEILDYGTDNEEEEDRFANDGLPKSMMLPEGML